jgi:hypothetical protein
MAVIKKSRLLLHLQQAAPVLERLYDEHAGIRVIETSESQA